MIRTVAQTWLLDERSYSTFAMSDATKLDVLTGEMQIALLPDDGVYPLDDDLYVEIPAIAVGRARTWVSFDADEEVPTVAGVETGEIGYRLTDGADTYWWDGADWTAPAAGEWNPLATVQSNIQSFPVTERKLGVVVHVATTDEDTTPTVSNLRLLYDVDVEGWDVEYLLRTTVASIRNGFTIDVRLTIESDGTASYDLSEFESRSGYTLSDVVEAYDLAADPDWQNDIFSSYNPVTGALVLTDTVAAATKGIGLIARVAFTVVFQVHPQYPQRVPIPSIILRDSSQTLETDSHTWISFTNRSTGESYTVMPPRIVSYDIPVDFYLDRTMSAIGLADRFEEWVQKNPTLTSPATGLRTNLSIKDRIQFYPRADEDSVVRATCRITVSHAQKWIYPRATDYATTAFEVAIS